MLGARLNPREWIRLSQLGLSRANNRRRTAAAFGSTARLAAVGAGSRRRLRPFHIRRHRFIGQRMKRLLERHHLLAFAAEAADRDQPLG
jgi:hypothetical protein